MATSFDFGLDFGVGELEAIVAAGLFGAFQGGLMLQLWSVDAIRAIGGIVGVPTLTGGWLTLFGLGILLCVPFVAFVSGTINQFVNKVIVLSSRSDVLRKLLVPLLNVSALGVTLFALGQIYGIILGVVVFGIAMPLWLTVVVGYAVPLPWIDPVALFGWSTYGGMMGLVYGLISERRE